jgi:drug/metabolite transporter (DMT)-like permease
MHQHKHSKNQKGCLYCKAVQLVSFGEPPPVKGWKRPLLLVAGVALTACTVMAMNFAWERAGATFFAAVTSIVMMIALLGVAISFRGCDNCVARFLGKTL